MRVALRISWVNAARVPAEPGVGKGGVACVTGGDADKTRVAVADGQRRRLVGGDHVGCRRGVLLATKPLSPLYRLGKARLIAAAVSCCEPLAAPQLTSNNAPPQGSLPKVEPLTPRHLRWAP